MDGGTCGRTGCMSRWIAIDEHMDSYMDYRYANDSLTDGRMIVWWMGRWADRSIHQLYLTTSRDLLKPMWLVSLDFHDVTDCSINYIDGRSLSLDSVEMAGLNLCLIGAFLYRSGHSPVKHIHVPILHCLLDILLFRTSNEYCNPCTKWKVF